MALIIFGLVQAQVTTVDFAREVERSLPPEELFDLHKQLSEGPLHLSRRDPAAKPEAGEMALPEQEWMLVWNRQSSPVLQNAAWDFQEYLQKSMQVQETVEGRDSLQSRESLKQTIVVGTRDQLAGCANELKGPTDYRILVSPDKDLPLQLAKESAAEKAKTLLNRMETILRAEIDRTELSLIAASRDSRLGFQFEQDYVYTPYSLREELELLRETLEKQFPASRKKL